MDWRRGCGPDDGIEEVTEPVAAPEHLRPADPATDGCEKREDRQRKEHHATAVMDSVAEMHSGHRNVSIGPTIARPALAEECHVPEAEHIEGGQAGSEDADEP